MSKMMMWFAWHLPRKVVYWCTIRLMAHATQGCYRKTEVSSLPIMKALERW